MFSLLSCVETFKEIEIFVEQYCINCKGIEKEFINFWLILMGFRIFRILNIYGADHYFFGSWGMKIFPRQTIFFLYRCLWKHFFSGVIFLQTIFFMPAKSLVGLFLLLQTNFSGFPPSKSVRSSYGLQRTNLLTWIDELKP